MKDYNELLTAGISAPFHGVGTFFRLLSTAAAVDVIFYKGGAEVSRASQMEAGFAEEMGPGEIFDSLKIVSAINQTVKWSVRNRGRVHYDRMAGSLSVDNTGGDFSIAQKTVTTGSSELVAANPLRKYLLIQNKSASGNIFFSFVNPAVASQSIRIDAGGSFEFAGLQHAGAIYALGDIVSNPDVIVMEA